jgi:pyroglutamyl-peptidase
MPRRTARRAPRILLTGFEPFGGESDNPSMPLLRALDGARLHGHRIATALLPVSFADAPTALADALQREAPALVLALGQAGGRARLSLERVALNLADARIPDNRGAQPIDVALLAGAPAAYFATLPLKAMLRALHERGIPAELSLSAGSYVCNAVFFVLLHLLAASQPRVRAGFMHLPYLPAQAARHPGASSMALETTRDGVVIALQAALDHPHDVADVGGTIC